MFSSRTLCFLVFFICMVVRECEGDETKGYNTPVQCSEVDCPKYNVIHSEKEFEIRNYDEALWVTAPAVESSSLMGGLGKAGDNLTWYYHHENEEGVNILTSGPFVMMDVLKSTYTMYFYVPYKYQNGSLPLPKPLTPEIKQVKLPKYKYAAVRRANNDILDDNVAAQVDALKKNLQGTVYKQAADPDRNQYTFVMYDEGNFTAGYELLIWFD